MEERKEDMRRAVLIVIAVLLIAGFGGDALAWSNHADFGGAARSAGICSDPNGYLRSEAGWADSPAHNDGIGARYVSEEYKHRSCLGYGDMAHYLKASLAISACGLDFGDAHTNAQGFFGQANYYHSIGATGTSRIILGRGQHYIQDVGNPWHASSPLTQGCHLAVESWIASNYASKNFNNNVVSGAVYARSNAAVTTNKSALTQAAADKSWSVGLSLGCTNYSTADSTWRTIMYWTGYYNFAYYKPICS